MPSLDNLLIYMAFPYYDVYSKLVIMYCINGRGMKGLSWGHLWLREERKEAAIIYRA